MQETEKPALVHWYYSISEWKEFLKKEYGLVSYFFGHWILRRKAARVPQIIIENGTVTVNGRATVFHGNGKELRKVDVIENNRINMLEITFERQTRKGIRYEEIKVPVPRGKLREAIELQGCLNLRRDILSLFS